MTITTAHTLSADGAAFVIVEPGVVERVSPTSTAGTGRAKCGCGWLSEELPTRSARKTAHMEHKMYPSTTPSAATAEPDTTPTQEETPVTETAEKPAKATKAKTSKAKAEPVAEEELPASEATGTIDYGNAAKHFWRSLSKGAVDYVGGIEGVDDAHADYKTRTIVVEGTAAAVEAAQIEVPQLWADAYAAIKEARKTDTSLAVGENEDKAARYARYKNEQAWMLAFAQNYTYAEPVAEEADTDEVL